MVGSRRARRSLHRHSSNAGNCFVGKIAAIATRLFKADKFSSWQTAQSRLLEFPRGTSRLQLAAIDTIAKHLGYDFVSAKEMDLETVCLFLRARFCVDAANVCLRIRIRTSSHEAKLTKQSQQATRHCLYHVFRRAPPSAQWLGDCRMNLDRGR
jgi:hypothetical protein